MPRVWELSREGGLVVARWWESPQMDTKDLSEVVEMFYNQIAVILVQL